MNVARVEPELFMRLRARMTRVVTSELWVAALALVYFIVLLPFAPELGRAANIELIVSSALPLCAVALGQMLVLITGGIDLSVTSIVALASVGGAWVMTSFGLSGLPAVLAGVFVMLAIGAAIGWLNGTAVTRLHMPPFMVTLATMMFGSGLALYLTRSKGIPGLPEALAVLAQEGLGPVPFSLFVVGPFALACHHLLARTVFGRWLYAIGANPRAAVLCGVPVAGGTRAAYVLCGMSAALGSLLYTGRLETGSPVLGQRIFLDVIGAAVIGGTSLLGGRGRVLGTLFGVIFITLVDNSLNILGLSSFTILMVKGAVILLAAWADVARVRRGRASGARA